MLKKLRSLPLVVGVITTRSRNQARHTISVFGTPSCHHQAVYVSLIFNQVSERLSRVTCHMSQPPGMVIEINSGGIKLRQLDDVGAVANTNPQVINEQNSRLFGIIDRPFHRLPTVSRLQY